MLSCFRQDESGATGIECGVVAGAAALVILTAFWSVGDTLQARLMEIAGAVSAEKDREGAVQAIVETRRERR